MRNHFNSQRMNNEITPDILQPRLHFPLFNPVFSITGSWRISPGTARHVYQALAGNSCARLSFAATLSLSGARLSGNKFYACAIRQELLPIVCFANYHLLIPLVALSPSVATRITASSPFSPCKSSFYGALPSLPRCFPACRWCPLGCAEVHSTLWSKT